jgi:hypothetical protein
MRIGDRRGLSLEAKTALSCIRRLGLQIPIKPPPHYKGSVSKYKQKRKQKLAADRRLILNRLKAKLASLRRQKTRLRGERIDDEIWPMELPPQVLMKADDGGPGFPILPDWQYYQGQNTGNTDGPQTTPNLEVILQQEDAHNSKRLQMVQDAIVDKDDDDVNKIAATFNSFGGRVVELPDEIRHFFEKNPRPQVWTKGLVRGPSSKQIIIDVPEGVVEHELLNYLPWCGKRDQMGKRIYTMPDDTDIIIRQKSWDGQIYSRLYLLPENIEVRDMYGSQHMPEGRINPMHLVHAHYFTPDGDLIIYVDNSELDDLMALSPSKLEESEDRDLQLLACERVFALHLRSMLEVGKALHKVRKLRLYERREMTFMQYCRVFWGISRAHADRLIAYVEVYEILRPIASAKVLCNEGQLRPLTRVRKPDGTLDASTIRMLWNRVVHQAQTHKELARLHVVPENRNGGRIVTAALVDSIVRRDWMWRGLAVAKCKAKVIKENLPDHTVMVKLDRYDPDSMAVLMSQTFDHGCLIQLVLRLLQFFRQPAPDCGYSGAYTG